MACNKRGAPVSDCKPAPKVDRNDPIRITHSFGQAILATTNLPPIETPNLSRNSKLSTVAPKNTTADK